MHDYLIPVVATTNMTTFSFGRFSKGKSFIDKHLVFSFLYPASLYSSYDAYSAVPV